MLSFKNKLFPKYVSAQNALGISIMLHLFITAAFGTYWVGSIENRDLNHVDDIVLNLETIKFKPEFSHGSSSEYGKSNSEAEKKSGKASNLVKGNMNRDAILKASLASMEDFIKPFRFVTQTIVSDSTGGFSIVDGDMPGSQLDSYGTKKGEGAGHGGGIRVRVGGYGGLCAPTGGR